MRLILNLLLIIVLALCTWNGFRRGIVNSIAGILSIVLALTLGNFFASTYSKELVSALNPFINGYVDSDTTTQSVLETIGYGDSELSLNDILEQDTSLRYDYAYEVLHSMGIYKGFAEELANDCVNVADANEVSMTEATTTVVSNTAAYVLCITVFFILFLVLISAFIDLINVEVHIPSLPVTDEILGAVCGLLKGMLYCVLICWVLGFLGIAIGKTTADNAAVVRFFLAFRFITRTLI